MALNSFYHFDKSCKVMSDYQILEKTSKCVIKEKFETRIAKLRYQTTHKMQFSNPRTITSNE